MTKWATAGEQLWKRALKKCEIIRCSAGCTRLPSVNAAKKRKNKVAEVFFFKSYQVTLMKSNLVRRLLTVVHLEGKGDDLVAEVFT